MFEILKGTEIKAIRSGLDWYDKNMVRCLTKQNNLFDKHEVVLDPVGQLGCCRNDRVIGGSYERAGYYGFKKGNWTMIVHASKVQYLD
jgi:hypothetical protein